MAEKYAVGAQAAGTINLKGPVEDVSNPGVTQIVSIPAGMICIGPNGKGYVISANTNYTFTPPLSGANSYVLYATAPTDSSGYVTISHDTYSNYIAGGGDNDNRRAFCYFLVRSNNIIDPGSFLTFTDNMTVDDSRTFPINGTDTDVKLNNQILHHLKKMGFYINTRADVGFTYRGQNYIENVELHTAVEDWDLVYYDLSDNKYHQALADDTYKETVVGIVEKDRDGISGNNFLITSGLVYVGTTKLPADEYPAGTYLYLCESATLPDGSSGLGKIVRDFDGWEPNKAYVEGDRIGEITNDTEKTGWIMEVTTSGQSGATIGLEPDWSAISAIGDTVLADGTVNWECVGEYSADYLGDRNVRVGVSMGDGIILLHSATSQQIDDHNDSPYAHDDIQAALNKAGIYVINTAKGLTSHNYRGQMFDEYAVFDGTWSTGDISLVYRHTNNKYRKALADDGTPAHQEVCGVSFDVVDDGLGGYTGIVLANGFINYNTSSFTAGDKLYLSDSVDGGFTNASGLNIFVGYCLYSATAESGGLIALQISGSGVHNADAEAHPLIQDALRRAGIFVVGGYTHEYVGQGHDTDLTSHPLDSGLTNYDIVYFGDYPTGATPKYRRAIAAGDERGDFVGMILDDGTYTQVISSGFVEIPQVGGTNILPDSTFPAGTPVYLTTELSGNCYSADVSSIKLGTSLGGGVLLLQSRGAGGAGNGDVTFEDYTYMELWKDNNFNQIYYDRFDMKESVTASGAEYTFNDGGYYTGDAADYIEYEFDFTLTGEATVGGSGTILIDNGDVPFTDNTKVNVGDTILNVTDGSSATIVSIDSGIQLTTTALSGGSDDTWSDGDIWSVQHEFGRFFVHAEYDSSAALVLTYWDLDSGGSWQSANFDEEFSSIADQSSIKVRFTWAGTGNMQSYGVLFDYTYGPYGMSRLDETLILSGDVAADVDVSIPRNGRYINNDKSLLVYRNGYLQERVKLPMYGGDNTGDYIEKNNTTITVKTVGGWSTGDRIQFIEPYSQYDASASNTERILAEHTEEGAHLLQDKVTMDWYLLEVHNGQLRLIPQS